MKAQAYKLFVQGVKPELIYKSLEISRAGLYRARLHGPHKKPSRVAVNALSGAEVNQILDTLHSKEFIEDTPYQVVSKLMDRGQWLCSIRSMYRILSKNGEVRERRNQRRHPKFVKPVIEARAPNQLWSWDITRLCGPYKGCYYFLYVMIDVYSRYVVGWMISDKENADEASHFIRETKRRKQNLINSSLTIHSDRGSPMTASHTTDLLLVLGLTQSFSRPRVSDDNAFSEAQFKTLKYHRYFKPWYESLEDAEKTLSKFFEWYNNEHRHINLGLLTPAMVFGGKQDAALEARAKTLQRAYERNPERFMKKGPKLLVPQSRVGINVPVKRESIYALAEEM
ncbi:MAG: IS3 family transposase [Oligoflexus sp.]